LTKKFYERRRNRNKKQKDFQKKMDEKFTARVNALKRGREESSPANSVDSKMSRVEETGIFNLY